MNIHGPTVRVGLLAVVLFGVAFSAVDSLKDVVSLKPKLALGTRASCEAYKGLPMGWGKAKHAGMIKIPMGEQSFWMDRTEVSNAQFAAFVAATGHVTEGEKGDITAAAHDPVVNVSYVDALAYAHWLGRALPTEAQWQYAAKGAGNNTQSNRTPVGCSPANSYGLYDMDGNVEEWASDHYAASSGEPENLSDKFKALLCVDGECSLASSRLGFRTVTRN